jgi:hypothetical protein
LYWPEGWKRTKDRETARFETHFVKARDGVLRSLKLMRASDTLISSNVPLRRDGLPLAGMAEPADPGVAVYWVESKPDVVSGKTMRVLACDKWRKVRDNLRAIELTLESFRAIERHGASEVLDRAFTGFTALPASAARRTWREVLGLVGIVGVTRDRISAAYRELALRRHPDHGGSDAAFIELTAARDQALAEIGAQ